MLRALRESAGITQEGWAALLGYGRATVQRWESGQAAPGPDAEDALLRVCRDRGLLRSFEQGPLRGSTISAPFLHEVLLEARLSLLPPATRQDTEAGAHEPTEAGAPATPGRADLHHGGGRGSTPVPLTRLVGRETVAGEVRGFVRRHRLLTLTGIGGVGKTRLAIHAASEGVQDFEDGVWFVELAALADPSLVLPTVVATLGGTGAAGPRSRQTLAEVIGARRVLVVLDNCEHVLEACASLVEPLLRACPHLHLLATSRVPLGLIGEVVLRVPPLDVPDLDALERLPPDRSADAALASASVRLFVERATAAQPDFQLTGQNAVAVARICSVLDGVPLAVELAAGRTRALSADQIARRLGHLTDLLSGGSRSALPRHHAMRAALDWSHALLAEPERRLFRRLGVFSGAFELEAAEAVCGVEDTLRGQIADLLPLLVERSLVAADVRAGEARYRLIELVRQYAAERLAVTGEADVLRRRHRDWYLALAERAEPYLRGPEQHTWLDRLDSARANFQAALEWSLSSAQESDAALRLATALRDFWLTRGHPAEGRLWLERGLRAPGIAPAPRAKAQQVAGTLAHSQGEYTAARALLEESLVAWQVLGHREGEARALSTLGNVAKAQGELDRAATLLQAALVAAREAGDAVTAAAALNNLAALAMDRAQYAAAGPLLQESLALKRQLGDQMGQAVSLYNLGDIALHLGRYDEAEGFLEESHACFTRLGAADRVAQALHGLGMVAFRRGDADQALARLRRGLAAFEAMDDRWGLALCLEALAMVYGAGGAADLGARLFAAAAAWREASGSPVPPNDRDDYAASVEVLRNCLGQAAFGAAWQGGSALPLADAVALALSAPDPPSH